MSREITRSCERAESPEGTTPAERLDFTKLDIKYFGSFVEQQFDFSQHGNGLHYLQGRNEYEPRLGSNGSGKSTIWNALTWCLFGKTVDNRRNPDILPRVHKGKTAVTVCISRDEITRTAKPNQLLINGKIVGQEDLNKHLSINFDLFCNTILLGQGQPLFFDLTPSDAMRLLATTLDFERWELRSKDAYKLTNDIQYEWDGKAKEIATADALIAHIKTSLDTAKKRSETWSAERSARLQEQEKQLSELKKQLEIQRRLLDKATLEEEWTSTEFESMEKELRKLSAAVNSATLKYRMHELEVLTLEKEITSSNQKLMTISESKKCPTCGQSITSSQKNHIDEIKNDIVSKTKQISDLKTKMAGVYPAKDKERLVTLNTTYEEFRAKMSDSRVSFYTRACDTLEVKVAKTNNVISELSNSRNIYQEQVRDHNKQLDKQERAYAELVDLQKDMGRKVEQTKFWIKGFKDIQLYVLIEVLQELEFVSNSMLPEIGLEGWQIQYSIEKENKDGSLQSGLHIYILSPSDSKPVKWSCWSGGEGQRLRLVGALALSDVLLTHAGVTTNLEILDEPTQHLSQEGVRDLCPFLAERARVNNKQIWLVDHCTIPSSEFSSAVTVVKSSKQVSMIEAGG